MEDPPTSVAKMFETLHAAQEAVDAGKLTSRHYHNLDSAIVEALKQLSPVVVESAEETKQRNLPVEQPADDDDSAEKFQALLQEYDGQLESLAKDRKALDLVDKLFPSLQGRDELEEMLAMGVQDVPTVSGGGEAKVQSGSHAPQATKTGDLPIEMEELPSTDERGWDVSDAEAENPLVREGLLSRTWSSMKMIRSNSARSESGRTEDLTPPPRRWSFRRGARSDSGRTDHLSEGHGSLSSWGDEPARRSLTIPEDQAFTEKLGSQVFLQESIPWSRRRNNRSVVQNNTEVQITVYALGMSQRNAAAASSEARLLGAGGVAFDIDSARGRQPIVDAAAVIPQAVAIPSGHSHWLEIPRNGRYSRKAALAITTTSRDAGGFKIRLEAIVHLRSNTMLTVTLPVEDGRVKGEASSAEPGKIVSHIYRVLQNEANAVS
ncbi:unnamed protein product [Scytosiphon promiscuus]